MKLIISTLLVTFLLSPVFAQSTDSLVIQENNPGVCTYEGVIENDAGGYTGDGYINVDGGYDVGISWSVNAINPGTYNICWQYALGGSDTTSRDGALYINNVFIDTVVFRHSGSSQWSVWITTDTLNVDLKAGINSIRLSAVTAKGLSNIDYFVLYGSGLSPAECLPSFPISVEANNALAGTVSWEPVQPLYNKGTEITVTATSNPGYFFHSWSGEEASISNVYTFAIQQKTDLTALFYAEGTVADSGANGYASIQHDNGTPYMLTGGNAGITVEPTSLEELKSFLESDEPLVVNVSKHFIGEGEIAVNSNKSLIGINDSAHIEGLKISIADSRNIIIRNLTFSKVVTYDEMEINRSKNIWIDRCEFFTDRGHHKDYYDGLLDIKNASSFITVSWCNFHDHFKAILISSGPDSYQDSVQRITFHHNYFHNIGSRLPSIRFGKAHIFSNYYENIDDGIHTRLGACVKVEHNYFKNVDGAIKTSQGFLDMEPATNVFNNSPYTTTIPPCSFNVPYPYDHLIDNAELLPELIPPNVREFAPGTSGLNKQRLHTDVKIFPNPCSDIITFEVNLKKNEEITIAIYNALGIKTCTLIHKQTHNAGSKIFNASVNGMAPGMYYCQIIINDTIIHRKVLVDTNSDWHKK